MSFCYFVMEMSIHCNLCPPATWSWICPALLSYHRYVPLLLVMVMSPLQPGNEMFPASFSSPCLPISSCYQIMGYVPLLPGHGYVPRTTLSYVCPPATLSWLCLHFNLVMKCSLLPFHRHVFLYLPATRSWDTVCPLAAWSWVCHPTNLS
jgi:hypothetical protein